MFGKKGRYMGKEKRTVTGHIAPMIRCTWSVILLCYFIGLLSCIPIQAAAEPEKEVVTVMSREGAQKYVRDSLMRRDKVIQLEASAALIREGIWSFAKNEAKRRDAYLYEILGNAAVVKSVVLDKRGKIYRYTMTMSYQETLSETKFVDRKVKSILKSLRVRKYRAVRKLKLISDWIVKNIKYDDSLIHSSAYAALTCHRATCMGYSLLAYKMFSAAGIPCKFVRGYTKSSVYHMWNAVKLNGTYYYVDICWMDSYPNGMKSNDDYFLFGKTRSNRILTIEQGYRIKNISKKGFRKK